MWIPIAECHEFYKWPTVTNLVRLFPFQFLLNIRFISFRNKEVKDCPCHHRTCLKSLSCTCVIHQTSLETQISLYLAEKFLQGKSSLLSRFLVIPGFFSNYKCIDWVCGGTAALLRSSLLCVSVAKWSLRTMREQTVKESRMERKTERETGPLEWVISEWLQRERGRRVGVG